uniref:Uncharacterized protein n=1 Tax=Anguilla anguilla TaxID=7936 RepID=A0A0E9P867_ANGAN
MLIHEKCLISINLMSLRIYLYCYLLSS